MRRRPTGAALGMVLIALPSACGDEPTGTTIPTPATTAVIAATTTPTIAPPTDPSTTVPVATDPPSTIVTFSGLLCADEWYDGSYTFDSEAVGLDTIDQAIDDWWRAEVGLGWDRVALQPTLNEDGRTTRYATATGRPVLLLVAEEAPGGGWAIGSMEGCSEN